MGFDPKGKPFKDRLDAMIKDAKASYGVKLKITSNSRTSQQQQTMHVGHMFLFNAYAQREPAHAEKNGDGRMVIAWGHLSRADVEWAAGVKWEDFLRDAKGEQCVKDMAGKAWAAGHEPDKAQTQKHARWLLKDHYGVGKGGRAMAAPGLDGCGEPCKCGVQRSRHVEGLAADLGALDELDEALGKKKAGSLDGSLAKFGLQRPLKGLAKDVRELWYVEAMPD